MPEAAVLEPVPLSALQHYVYCPRQCALIHVEGAWDENVFTLRGARAHERADTPEVELLEGVRLERALPLWSESFGLVGKADVVEFGADGTPYPVEYKAGPRRTRAPGGGPGEADDLQLCAQALCLEEMFGLPVPRGAIFQHASRRRREVEFTLRLRARTLEVAGAVRLLLAASSLPPPVADARCPPCSLLEVCEPHLGSGRPADPFRLEPDPLELGPLELELPEAG